MISPELDRIISAVAEAKMHLLIALHGCKADSPERAKELRGVATCAAAARGLLPLIGGFERLSKNVAIELRVCEMAVERLAVE